MVEHFVAKTLDEALEILDEKDVTIFSGGTDLMVGENERSYLFLHHLDELKTSKRKDGYWIFGAGLTFTEIMEDENCPDILKEAIMTIAAPGIRNIGTIGGNIANGSSKADAALVLVAADAKIRLQSKQHDRTVDLVELYDKDAPIKIEDNELIREIYLPMNHLDNYYFNKIGPRKALAISRLGIAGLYDEKDGVIEKIAIAINAIDRTILRFREIEEILEGKTKEEAKKHVPEFMDAYDKALQPRDGRTSAEYRKGVSMNLIEDFLRQNGLIDQIPGPRVNIYTR